jgi:hypothetical protein
MKTVIVAIVVSLLPVVNASAQWVTCTGAPPNSNGCNSVAVGIGTGTGTTGPSEKLDVNGNVKVAGSGIQGIGFGDPTYAVASGGVYLVRANSGLTGAGNFLHLGGWDGMAFHVGGTPGSPSAPKMVISTSGNIGIGTTTPLGQLSLNNQIDLTPALLNYAALSGVAGQSVFNGYLSNVDGRYSRYLDIAAVGSPDGTYGGSVIRFLTNAQTSSPSSAVERMRIDRSGNVGIGTLDPQFTLDVTGNARFTGSINASSVIGAVYQDLAEWVPASGDVPPGTVVILNSEKSNEVMPSTRSYDTRVAGVVSERPGLLLGQEGASKAKIATTGRVKVRVDATKHAIHVGDLLVTGDRPGTAMVSMPLDLGGVKIHRPGTLIGKALEPLPAGEGEILVLLSLQ